MLLATNEPYGAAGCDRQQQYECGDDRDGWAGLACGRRCLGACARRGVQRGYVLGECVDEVHYSVAVLVVPSGWALVDGGGGQAVYDFFTGEVREAGPNQGGRARDDRGG